MIPTALTIAGSDPSGGAGIQADLKTFHQHKVYGMAVVTLLTVQNTRGVSKVFVVSPSLVIKQIQAVASDISPHAIKTGALGSRDVMFAVARSIQRLPCPVVIDPVMISKHGALLISKNTIEFFKKKLLPLATLITPNLQEASVLAGFVVKDLMGMEKAARMIAKMGAEAVLVKGGHLKGEASDLFFRKGEIRIFTSPRIRTRHTHGTGCTYAAAITAELAKGKKMLDAVGLAKRYVSLAIQKAPGLGKGVGPVNHWAAV